MLLRQSFVRRSEHPNCRNAVPQLSSSLTLTAWKGERVSAQAVLVCPNAIDRMSFTVTDLTCGKQVIPASQVKKYFVRYVLCDSLPDRSKELLLADRLQPATEMTVPASTVRPLWLDIKVPSDQAPGKYKCVVKLVSVWRGMCSLPKMHTIRL